MMLSDEEALRRRGVTEMAATTKTLEIGLARTIDSTSLFEDTTGANVEASMERFDDLLLAAVSEAFPEADVEIVDKGYVFDREIGTDINPADTDETHQAWLRIQSIADDIHNRGEWVVEAE
jgi:hypothetical protein